MKRAATLLYEDSLAPGAAKPGLHQLMETLVSDTTGYPRREVADALGHKACKGVDKVLTAVIDDWARHAPNGRALVACVDADRIAEHLSKRKPPHADIPSLNAALPAKVRVFPIGRNAEELLIGAAKLMAVAPELLHEAVVRKDRTARDTVFQRLAWHNTLRVEFLKNHAELKAVVAHVAPLVSAFLSPPTPNSSP